MLVFKLYCVFDSHSSNLFGSPQLAFYSLIGSLSVFGRSLNWASITFWSGPGRLNVGASPAALLSPPKFSCTLSRRLPGSWTPTVSVWLAFVRMFVLYEEDRSHFKSCCNYSPPSPFNLPLLGLTLLCLRSDAYGSSLGAQQNIRFKNEGLFPFFFFFEESPSVDFCDLPGPPKCNI